MNNGKKLQILALGMAIIYIPMVMVSLNAYNTGKASADKETTLNIKDMTMRQCDDIVGKTNAYTGKRELVCEIQMVEEDDNIIILKEN